MKLFKTVLLASALALSANVSTAETAATASLSKADIEKIVHDYLIENPEILMEMNVKLQKKMAEEAVSMDKAYINEYRD